MTDLTLDRRWARFRGLAVLGYGILVAALLFMAWLAVADILARRQALAGATDMLARLEGRSPSARAEAGGAAGPTPTGSPFLEGQTVTVAGAALLQRVAGAVTRVGGSVLSSQVELEGAQSKEGYVSLIVSCELEQPALQQVLYDIEAGMPFLFVDQLVAQAPAASEGGRMRVLLAVSGLWSGGK